MSSGSADSFEFLVGSWTSIQRRLAKPLAACREWRQAAATARCWRALDGASYVEELAIPEWGMGGLTVNLLNAGTGEWSIYWASTGTGEVAMPPAVGRFEAGTGTFWADEEYEGRPIRVRQTWSEITATSARWEQAFSTDGEKSWEVNWVAEFARIS